MEVVTEKNLSKSSLHTERHWGSLDHTWNEWIWLA